MEPLSQAQLNTTSTLLQLVTLTGMRRVVSTSTEPNSTLLISSCADNDKGRAVRAQLVGGF